MSARVFETTREAVSGAAIGVQFLHASAQASALLGGSAFKPGFLTNPSNGAGFKLAVPAGGVALWNLSPPQAVAGVTDSDHFALGQTDPTAPPQALLPSDLPSIQSQSGLGPSAPPTVYTAGKNFVFIAVGDPALAVGQPKAFHFLAFPTDPSIAPYKP